MLHGITFLERKVIKRTFTGSADENALNGDSQNKVLAELLSRSDCTPVKHKATI